MGKLGLVLMGGAMLSKSLIQFSVEACVPSLLFGLRPDYGRGNKKIGRLYYFGLQKSLQVTAAMK